MLYSHVRAIKKKSRVRVCVCVCARVHTRTQPRPRAGFPDTRAQTDFRASAAMAHVPHTETLGFTDGQRGGKLANLTPHTVTLYVGDDELTIPSHGEARVACVEQTSLDALRMPGKLKIPVVSPPHYRSDNISGLENVDQHTAIIVSMIVAQTMLDGHMPWEGAILTPDTGPGSVVRDAQGRIQGVRRLVRWK